MASAKDLEEWQELARIHGDAAIIAAALEDLTRTLEGVKFFIGEIELSARSINANLHSIYVQLTDKVEQ